MQIWVDTGGTFTDGVAVDDDGTQRTVKILSTSALRGTVVASLGSDRLRVTESWSAAPGVVDGSSGPGLGRTRVAEDLHDTLHSGLARRGRGRR